MVAISWEDFRLDGEIDYKKEGFDIMGVDGYGTRREKIVKGIRAHQSIKYVQNESTPEGIIKYLMPIAQALSVAKPTAK